MPKVLCVQSDSTQPADLPFKDDPSLEVTYVTDCSQAISMLREQKFDGCYFAGHQQQQANLLQNQDILDWMPNGLALLDHENKIIKANKRLTSWFQKDLVGLDFYLGLGAPSILGPESTPLLTSRSQLQSTDATLLIDESYYHLTVVPIVVEGQKCEQLLATLTDATAAILHQEKTEALHKAGTALADLRPEEIYQMGVDERIDLLKDNILHYTNELLDFDVIEIRMLDRPTNLLVPLLSVGIDSDVASQPLFALAKGNGVTGFVVATGESYICQDTTNDPIYLDGLMGAKSSLTVPLIYHDEVIGSFNVESPEVDAFDETDLHFLESFARDIAVSINTLELLNAQRTDAAMQSVSAIHEAVEGPINEILNDTVHAIESYIGHDPEVTGRLKTILAHARQIRRTIRTLGQEMAPEEAVPACLQSEVRPTLKGKNILVIDADEEVRCSARQLLGRYGCVVETAHEGNEAIMMVRNCDFEDGYDAIIADIRLPDIGGYDLLMRLKELVAEPPLILMTGFGYDPGHSIVKARQAGLQKNAVLFKPFRIDQLIEVTESVIGAECNAG